MNLSPRSLVSPPPTSLLAFVLVYGLVAQLAVLAQAAAHNPFFAEPLSDAQVYWAWGGDIARGKLVAETPFMSAPLYPYLVGAVRAFGGGLIALSLVQIALHLTSAYLVARIAARRFGAGIGVLAAAIFVLLADPAFSTTRVLNSTLQIVTVAWIWERACVADERRDKRSSAWLGLALGLGLLANPTFMPLVVLLPAWLVWRARRSSSHDVVRSPVVARAALVAVIALACIAPATWHNWLASREFIPLSAQAGLGFHHGNRPGAEGIYVGAQGASADRMRQTLDARDAVRAETDGTWKNTSRAYRDKGLRFLASDPLATVKLELLKLWWFVGGRHYGDVYLPSLEIADGFASRLWTSPLPMAFLTLPTLVLIVARRKRWLDELPDLLLFGATFATVLVFWYSPRYRMPTAPLLAVYGAGALAVIVQWRARPRFAATCAAALVASIVAMHALEASGRDDPSRFRAQYELHAGLAYARSGQVELAAERYARAAALGSLDADIARADLLRTTGRADEALRELRAAVEKDPRNAFAQRSLAIAQAQSGELDEARRSFERALAIDPNDWEAHSGLGNVVASRGAPDTALAHYRRALELQPTFAAAHFNLARALQALGRDDEALESYRAAVRDDPQLVQARAALSDLLFARGLERDALNELRVVQRARPDDPHLRATLAWRLATSSDESLRSGVDAVRLLELLQPDASGDAQLLDTWAAALAEVGRFDEALVVARRALAAIERDGPLEVLPEVRARAAQYEARRAWHQPAR